MVAGGAGGGCEGTTRQRRTSAKMRYHCSSRSRNPSIQERLYMKPTHSRDTVTTAHDVKWSHLHAMMQSLIGTANFMATG